jgi:hypothetical protein
MVEGSGILFVFVLLMGVAGTIAIVAALPARRTLMTAAQPNRRRRALGWRVYWSLKRRMR